MWRRGGWGRSGVGALFLNYYYFYFFIAAFTSPAWPAEARHRLDLCVCCKFLICSEDAIAFVALSRVAQALWSHFVIQFFLPNEASSLRFIVPLLVTSSQICGCGFPLTTERVMCDDLKAIKPIYYVITHTQGRAVALNALNS